MDTRLPVRALGELCAMPFSPVISWAFPAKSLAAADSLTNLAFAAGNLESWHLGSGIPLLNPIFL